MRITHRVSPSGKGVAARLRPHRLSYVSGIMSPPRFPPIVTTWLRRAFRFDEPRYLVAQVGLISRNLPVGMAASSLVALMVAGVHYHLAHDLWVWAWALLAFALGGVGLLIPRAEAATDVHAEGELVLARRQGRALWLLAGAIGLTWGSLAWFFMRTTEPHTINLVLGATAGLNAGGMVLFAPAMPLSVAYLIATVPPAAVALLLSPHPADQVMGLAVFTYLIAMLVFSYHASRAVRQSIDLRFENIDLVRRLRDQTQRAFDARQVAEEALHEAEGANHAKVVFMAAASHDLRQPLHALGLFASTLGRTTLSVRQRALLDQIDASAEVARDLLGTLLDFSKVDAGVITPRPQPFALRNMLQRLEQEFAPQAAEVGLRYRTHDTRAVVLADVTLVERILRNLVGNALRYTERGGVLIGCRLRGERVVVEVWDTGVGIPKMQQQAIFREFHQLGNPERDRRKGLGLGLAIVEGLARIMSVSVTVASAPGRGSVFRLTLPLSREAVLESSVAPPADTDLSGARVLVIDDDETVRAAMAELLTSWGAWCEVVETPEEAVALLSRFMPQVVVADYRLRGRRNGREALAMVNQRAGRAIPGVVITGDTGADRLREAQASGAVLLHKPVPARQLHEVLVDLLRVDQIRTQARAGEGEGSGEPVSPAG